MINGTIILLLLALGIHKSNASSTIVHENHEELTRFMKKGNIYNGEVFDEDFTIEGERGDRLVLIGRSTGYFKLAEENNANEDLKIKILNYVSSSANLKQYEHHNKYGRHIASNLSIRSRFGDNEFKKAEIKKLKCIEYMEPQLNLTYAHKVECRFLYSIPKNFFQIDNNLGEKE